MSEEVLFLLTNESLREMSIFLPSAPPTSFHTSAGFLLVVFFLLRAKILRLPEIFDFESLTSNPNQHKFPV